VDTVDTTHDISNDARRVLYIVMAGAQGGGRAPGPHSKFKTRS
jgi:hypothetical protein